jgi:exonuclease SbcD
VRQLAEDDGVTDQQSAMEEMVRRIGERRTSKRSVLVTHAFVQGGKESDSERTLSIGGAETIAAATFDGFTYAALGHLHRPQQIGNERIQYAGSLLKYSVSEADHDKSVTVVDIDGEGDVTIKRTALPILRDLRHLEATLDELISGEPQGNVEDFVYVTLRDKGPVYDAMARLRTVYPNANHIEQPQFVPEGAMKLPDQDHRSQSVGELFAAFFVEVEGEPLSDEESAALNEVIASLGNLEDGP